MVSTEIFEEAISVVPLSPHTYSGHLQKEWCIGTRMSCCPLAFAQLQIRIDNLLPG